MIGANIINLRKYYYKKGGGNMSNLICVTGKSGSGKSTFAKLLTSNLNGVYVDIDAIGHDVLAREDIAKELCQNFGISILDENQKLNRKKLGEIVFSSEVQMNILTELTWKYMESTIDNILKNTTQVVILDWILLPKTKYWESCYYKILVEAEQQSRKNIVLDRDKISSDYFEKRDSACLDYSSYEFNYKFLNDYTERTMTDALDIFMKQNDCEFLGNIK